jgi:hypothetical protein
LFAGERHWYEFMRSVGGCGMEARLTAVLRR